MKNFKFFLMALLCLFFWSCNEDEFATNNSEHRLKQDDSTNQFRNLISQNSSTNTFDSFLCCEDQGTTLKDYPDLESLIIPILETKLSAADKKRIRDGNINLIQTDSRNNFAITWDYFSNGLSKLIISLDHDNVLKRIQVATIELDANSKLWENPLDFPNKLKSITVQSVDQYLNTNKSNTDYCLKLINNPPGEGTGDDVNDDGDDPPVIIIGVPPTDTGGGSVISISDCLEAHYICGCGPKHIGGKSNSRCKCDKDDRWSIVNICNENIKDENIYDTKNSESYWDCVDHLLDCGILTNVDIVINRFKNCFGLGQINDQEGVDNVSAHDDEEFCSDFMQMVQDNCIALGDFETWANNYLNSPTLFSQMIETGGCMSDDEFDDIVCVEEAIDKMENDFDINITKFERQAILNNVNCGLDVNTDVLISYIEENEGLNIEDNIPGYPKLNDCEKEAVKVFPECAYLFNRNRQIAKSIASSYFPSDIGNGDCKDAFRHIFFNALNAQDCSSDIVELFGVAHECSTPAGDLNFLAMDLFNNGVGIELGASNVDLDKYLLADLVCEALDLGDAVVLEEPIDENSTIIISDDCECE